MSLSCYNAVKRTIDSWGTRPKSCLNYMDAVFIGDRSYSMIDMDQAPFIGAVTFMEKYKNFSEEERQNKLGNFLRKTGLDELPQLFNVFKNNMSFVGPRPLLIEYLKKYTVFEKKRHLVKPGITGLAQVSPEPSGKKSWSKSIKLDIFYVNNVSFFLDIEILFKTLILVLFKKKQYQDFKKTL